MTTWTHVGFLLLGYLMVAMEVYVIRHVLPELSNLSVLVLTDHRCVILVVRFGNQGNDGIRLVKSEKRH